MNKYLISSVAALGALASAATVAQVQPVFGETTDNVSRQDIVMDAAASFDKVDVDRSGDIDIDEFAAQSLVYAELARFNRLLTITGEREMKIDTPSDVNDHVAPVERTAIDAVARRTFHLYSEGGAPLTLDQWTDAKLADFDRANRNRNDSLEGVEIERFARIVARDGTARS